MFINDFLFVVNVSFIMPDDECKIKRHLGAVIYLIACIYGIKVYK